VAGFFPESANPALMGTASHYHFGRHCRTPSDFGAMGERPTNPALLDYLAATFVETAEYQEDAPADYAVEHVQESSRRIYARKSIQRAGWRGATTAPPGR